MTKKSFKISCIAILAIVCSLTLSSCGPKKMDKERLQEIIEISYEENRAEYAYALFQKFQENLSEDEKNSLYAVDLQLKQQILRQHIDRESICGWDPTLMENAPIELLEAAYEKGKDWRIGIEIGVKKRDVNLLIEILKSLTAPDQFAQYYVLTFSNTDWSWSSHTVELHLIYDEFNAVLANIVKNEPLFLLKFSESAKKWETWKSEENDIAKTANEKSLSVLRGGFIIIGSLLLVTWILWGITTWRSSWITKRLGKKLSSAQEKMAEMKTWLDNNQELSVDNSPEYQQLYDELRKAVGTYREAASLTTQEVGRVHRKFASDMIVELANLTTPKRSNETPSSSSSTEDNHAHPLEKVPPEDFKKKKD